jgi:hypothetical protein
LNQQGFLVQISAILNWKCEYTLGVHETNVHITKVLDLRQIFKPILSNRYLAKIAQLLRLDKYSPISGVYKNILPTKIAIRCGQAGYNYNFQQLDFVRAYNYRIRTLLWLHERGNGSERLAAQRYLSVAGAPDLIDLLRLPSDMASSLAEVSRYKDSLFDISVERSKEFREILLCGPSLDLDSVDFKGYDYIAFTKPPPEHIEIDGHRLILILNNQWVVRKGMELESWLSRRSPAHIFSIRELSSKNAICGIDKFLPKFPLSASLMGLQRALLILIAHFSIRRLDVRGFDMSLSTVPYKDWYPSLIREQFGSLREGLLFSNRVHDFLLNFMITRYILERNHCISGGALSEVAHTNIAIIFERLKNLFK